MDFESMTPDEIRAYAARKEAVELHRGHIGAVEAARPSEPRQPWERDVEFEGRAYRVDMRRVKSREFFVRVAAIQEAGENASFSQQIALFDYIFEPIERDVVEAVVEKCGYDDFEEHYRVLSGIFGKLELKN